MSIRSRFKQQTQLTSVPGKIQRLGYSWLIAIPLAILGVIFVFPLLSILYSSFFGPMYQPANFGVSGYTMLFYDFFDILFQTLKFAFITTFASILLALPVGFFMRDATRFGRNAAIFILIAPLMVNIIIRNYGWVILLFDNGIVNRTLMALGVIDSPLQLVRNEIGVYIGLIHVFLPFTALPIYDALSSLDPTLQEAARVHGATRVKTLFYVTLPNIASGIVAGGTIVFVLSLGIYVTPVIMGGNTVITLPMSMRRFTTEVLDWRFVTASATVLLLLATVTVAGVTKLSGTAAWREQ